MDGCAGMQEDGYMRCCAVAAPKLWHAGYGLALFRVSRQPVDRQVDAAHARVNQTQARVHGI